MFTCLSPHCEPLNKLTSALSGWENRIVPRKLILGIILALQFAQSLQPPRLVSVPSFEGLVAGSVVHVGRRPPSGLPPVPQRHSLVTPLSGKGDERVIRRVEPRVEISGQIIDVRV